MRATHRSRAPLQILFIRNYLPQQPVDGAENAEKKTKEDQPEQVIVKGLFHLF